MSRRSEEEWRELITQQQSSGISAAQFCREHSINPKYFSTRKQQLSSSASTFVQMTPSADLGASCASAKLRIIDVQVSESTILNTLSLLLEQAK